MSASNASSSPIHAARLIWGTRICYLLTFLFPLAIAVFIHLYGPNAPYWDEWHLAEFQLKVLNGHATWSDFIGQLNEHRITSIRVLWWAVTLFNRGNIVTDMFLGWSMDVLALLIFWRLLRRTFLQEQADGQRPFLVALLTCGASALMFMPFTSGNWLTAIVALQWNLNNLCAAVTIWAFARWGAGWRPLMIGYVATFLGVFSIVSGILLWSACLAATLAYEYFEHCNGEFPALRTQKTLSRVALKIFVWLLGLCAILAVYLHNYHHIGDDIFYAFHHPLQFIKGILAYLGAFLNLTVQPSGRALKLSYFVAVAGFALLGVFWFSADRNQITREARTAGVLRRLPWWMLLLYTTLVAAATAFGRASYDVSMLLSSRYASASVVFWIAGGVLAASKFAGQEAPRRSAIYRAAAGAAFLVFLVFYFRAYVAGARDLASSGFNRSLAIQQIYQANKAGKPLPRDAVRMLGPDENAVARLVEGYKKYQLAFYAPAMRETLARGEQRLTSTKRMVGRNYEGALEGGDCTKLSGWARIRGDTSTRLPVEIYELKGTKKIPLGEARAHWFRWASDTRPEGVHCFYFLLPSALYDNKPHLLRAEIRDTPRFLPGAVRIQCNGPRAASYDTLPTG